MFGHWEIDRQQVKQVYDQKLSAARLESDLFSYRREQDKSVLALRTFTSRSMPPPLYVYPVPPVYVPRPIAERVMVTFGAPLTLHPDSEVEVFISVPIEVGVFTSPEADPSSMIDVFSPREPRYALYGPPEYGRIARYHTSRLEAKEFEPGVGEASARVGFKNVFEKTATAHRIVLDSSMIHLYHDAEKVYIEQLTMEIQSENVAVVHLVNSPYKLGLTPVPDGAKSGTRETYVIRWGY